MALIGVKKLRVPIEGKYNTGAATYLVVLTIMTDTRAVLEEMRPVIEILTVDLYS